MIFNLENIYDDYPGKMRAIRNTFLQQSDWAMAPDAPTNKTAWATYRQALRDFPTTWEEGPEADFPDTP